MAHCAKCKKEFFPTRMHVYKDGRYKYCCWTCYKHRKDGKKRRTAKAVEWRTLDGFLLNTYPSAAEAAASIEGTFSAQSIRDACRTNRPYKGYLWNYKNT